MAWRWWRRRPSEAESGEPEPRYVCGWAEPGALVEARQDRWSRFLRSTTALLLLLALITAAGAALRFHRLGAKSLWVDEAISYVQAKEGWPAVEHPPLYFRLLGLTLRLAGREDELGLRLLSALCGIGAIPLLFLLGREAADRWAGLPAALLLALSPYHVQISQEARMYSLLCLLALAALLLELAALRLGGWRGAAAWTGCGLALGAALYTHHLAIVLLPATLLPLFAHRRPAARALVGWAAALLLAFLLYLPQLPRTVEQVSFRGRIAEKVEAEGAGGRFPEAVRPGARLVSAVRRAAGALYYMGAGYRYTDLSGEGRDEALARWPDRGLLPAYALLPAAALLLGLYLLARRGRREAWVLLGGSLLLVVAAGALEGSPPNHLAMALPAYAVFAGAGLRGRGWSWPRAILGLLLVGLALLALHGQYRDETYVFHKENWRQACAALEEEARPGDAVFVHGGRNAYFAVRYYYRGPAEVACYLPKELLSRPYFKEELPPFDLPGHLRALAAGHRRVWFLYPDWGADARQRELSALNRDFLVRARNFGADLFLFEYSRVRK